MQSPQRRAVFQKKTIENWVWPRKKTTRKIAGSSENESTRATQEHQITPAPVISEKQIIEGVKAMSDEGKKAVDLVIARSISTGKSAKRVGMATAHAVKRRNQESKRKAKGGEQKPIDNFYRLNNHFKVAIDGLTAWADGQMLPTSRDEAACARAILAKAANFCVQFARLGIDIEGVNEIFVKGKDNEKKQHYQIGHAPG